MKNQRDLRYSIRKLKCGVGSIAVAMVVFGANSTALATTMEQPSASEVARSSSDKMETDSTLSDEVAVKEEIPPTSEITPLEEPTEPTTTESQEPKETDLPKEPETITLTQEPAEPLPVAEARAEQPVQKGVGRNLQDIYSYVKELQEINYKQYGSTKDSDSAKNLDTVFTSNNKDDYDKSVALAGYVQAIVNARGEKTSGNNIRDFIIRDYSRAYSEGANSLREKFFLNSSISDEVKKKYFDKLQEASLIDIYKTIPEELEREVEKLKKDQPQGDDPGSPDTEEQSQKDQPAKPEEKQPENQDNSSADSEKEKPQKDAPADQSKIAEYKKIYEKIKELAEVNNYYKEAFAKQGQDLSETFIKSGVTDSKKLEEKLLSFIGADIIHRSGEVIKPKTIEEAKGYIDQDYKGELDKTVKEEIEKLNKSEASQNLKQKYQALFNKATSLTSAKKEIPEMFMKELAQEQKAEIERLAEEAKNKIYQMPHLKEKNSYVEQLEKVASKNEIENILKEAAAKNQKGKEDFEAANKVNKEIKDFKYLTQEQKNGYSNELEDKTKEEAAKILERAKTDNLNGLISKGKELIKQLEASLANLDKLPKAPETEDYNEQHNLWKEFSRVGTSKMSSFKQDSVKPDQNKFNQLEVKYNDLVDFNRQLQIESYTRQVAEYRKRYPESQKLEELFKNYIKQTPSNSYASQFGENLRVYFETELKPAFQEIQQLVNNLDKQAEGVQKIEKLIEEYSKKPKTTELVKELERQKHLISVLNDTALGLVDQHVKDAEDAVATYTKEYQMYLEVLKKGQEAMRSDIGRLRALKNEKATELANELEREVTYLATAELLGTFDYKTFIPENVAKVKKQVDDFIAEYERTHRPLTPLEPAIVETTEIQKEAI
ncbi:GAG-binding domain-containing protein, partial [Streptococcus merionis]